LGRLGARAHAGAASGAANKGNFGHVLVVGGTLGTAGGKSGAPAMTALAALRSGAGLVTAAVPAPALPLVAAIAPELMTWPLAATATGCVSAENLAPESLAALLMAGKTVLAIGPGLGQSPETVKFTTGLLSATKIPAVIDADALNILAAKPVLLAKLAKGRTLVLTPHPGEMARLAGHNRGRGAGQPARSGARLCRRNGVTLVLKGARTLIAHPDGRVAVNTTGNPGMAKGGSGDLLTGLMAGLLAQYPATRRGPSRRRFICTGWPRTWPCALSRRAHAAGHRQSSQLSRAFRFRARGGATGIFGCRGCRRSSDRPWPPRGSRMSNVAPPAKAGRTSSPPSGADTIEVGRKLAQLLKPPQLLLLRGDLGTGKTTLVKGIAQALDAAEADEVTSPTFTLLHEYDGTRTASR
jgi:hydroxyethylthiazole kinase-like uncharacterized protein yjeF